MAASTNYALALRAVRAAKWFEHWSEEIRLEMKKQGAPYDPGASYVQETIVLPAQTLNRMVDGMRQIAKEIRKFKAPAGSN